MKDRFLFRLYVVPRRPQTNLSTTVERNCNRSIRTKGRGTLLVWTNWATAATLLDWIPTYMKKKKVCFRSALIKYI